MSLLHVIAAGASKDLVTRLGERLEEAAGAKVEGVFGAVGAMRERLLHGDPCDVIILTQAQIDALAADSRIDRATVAPLGRVRTGIAVPEGARQPPIATQAALAAAFKAASAIYVPDTEQSTAGRHFKRVLQSLGIADAVAARIKSFPNGATAMRHLAEAGDDNAIGCTQITEINYTPGLSLVGPLPEELGLATIYTAAVTADAAQPDLARKLVALLAGPDAASLRARAGFEPVSPSSTTDPR